MRKRVSLPAPAGDIWPIGSRLITTLADQRIAVLVDPVAGRIVRRLPLPFPGNIVPNPSGTVLLVLAEDHAALVRIADGRVVPPEFTGGSRTGTEAAFSADGRLLAIGGDDQLIAVWDARTGELRDTLRGHAAAVHGLVFSADKKTLYSASRDNSIIAWDVAGDRSFGSLRSRTPGLPAPSNTADNALTTLTSPLVSWAGDRRRLYVLAGDGRAAALIDVTTGRSISSLAPLLGTWEGVADLDRQVEFNTTTNGTL